LKAGPGGVHKRRHAATNCDFGVPEFARGCGM
jgi:hypothetical protein